METQHRALLGVVLLFTVCACAAAQTLPPTEPPLLPRMSFRLEMLGDVNWGRETLLTVTVGDRLVIFNQNRHGADGTHFVYLAAGVKQKFHRLTLTGLAGPQVTNGQGVNRIVAMVNAAYRARSFTLDSANKFSFGVARGTAFVDRHVLRLGNARGLPPWLSVRTEILRTPKGIPEAFLGPQLQVRRGTFAGFYAYPYVNLANGNPDVRIGYTKIF